MKAPSFFAPPCPAPRRFMLGRSNLSTCFRRTLSPVSQRFVSQRFGSVGHCPACLRCWLNLVLLGLVLLGICGTAGQLQAEEPIDFSSQILPLLSDRCALCHGPDPTSREAELRLDVAEAVGQATQNGGRDLVIAPGDAAASELMRRITSDDASEQMPPPHANLSLTATEIELLRRWIDQGAKWEQHWSFRPLVRPQVPESVHKGPIAQDSVAEDSGAED